MKAWLFVLLVALFPAGLAQADEAADGKRLYEHNCLPCHDPQGTGTTMLGKRLGAGNALLAERRDLTAPYVRAVLRNGIGSMTWYRRSEITDAGADAIAAYLTRDRKGRP